MKWLCEFDILEIMRYTAPLIGFGIGWLVGLRTRKIEKEMNKKK